MARPIVRKSSIRTPARGPRRINNTPARVVVQSRPVPANGHISTRVPRIRKSPRHKVTARRLVKDPLRPLVKPQPRKAIIQKNKNNKPQRPVGGVKSGRHGGARERPKRTGRTVRKASHERGIRETRAKLREIKGRGRGKVLIIVACGPSISEVDLTQLKGHQKIHLMSINRPDPRIWPTDYWAFCDMTQYNRNKELWSSYDGTIVNSSSVRSTHKNKLAIRNKSGKGFSVDVTEGFYIGRSTTYANMQTAVHLGYNRVYVFGCDMSKVGDKLHYYGHNPDVADENRLQRFAKEAEFYQYAATSLPDEVRKRFYFCSIYNKWPFVQKFNARDHRKVIPEILEYANSLK